MRLLACLLLFWALLGDARPAYAATDDRALKVDQFLSAVFPDAVPKKQALWLRGALVQDIEKILGHRSSRLRVHYWRQGSRSAWVLDEIGKELPITAGFVVNNGVLESTQVLVYRESRGGEIQYTHFLAQFEGLARELFGLNRKIDNISGATLSVRSMKRMATMALRCSEALSVGEH